MHPKGLVTIGNGLGATSAGPGGLPWIVGGQLWAQIERERRDGPRYVDAIRGARDLRKWAYATWIAEIHG